MILSRILLSIVSFLNRKEGTCAYDARVLRLCMQYCWLQNTFEIYELHMLTSKYVAIPVLMKQRYDNQHYYSSCIKH